MTLFRKAQTRRALLGTSAVVASGAALAACAPGESQAPAQSKGPVTIEVLTRNGVASPSGHSQFYSSRAKNIFTPQTQVTVNFVDATPDVNEKLTVMAAGGSLPDASWFGVVADGSGGRESASKGVFKPIDDLAKKDTRFDIKPYLKAMLDAFTVNGKMYALPTHAHYGTNILYYNKNLTDAAAIRVPDDGSWTHDEMLTAAQKLTNRANDQWGFWPSFGFPEFGAFWVRQFGGEYIDEAGKKVLLDTAEARAAFDWVAGTRTKAQVIDDFFRTISGAPLNLGGSRGLFAMGKLAMHPATPGLVAEYLKPGQEEVKFPVGIALFPKAPNGKRGTQASGSGMGLTKLDKQDSVWQWLKFVSDKDNGVEQVFGGAGSPGGRTDVWNDAKLLKERGHIYSTIVKAFPQGAGSLRLAANYRYTALTTAVNAQVNALMRGEISVAEAMSKAVQDGNTELSR